jgi:hypothetical protein
VVGGEVGRAAEQVADGEVCVASGRVAISGARVELTGDEFWWAPDV